MMHLNGRERGRGKKSGGEGWKKGGKGNWMKKRRGGGGYRIFPGEGAET